MNMLLMNAVLSAVPAAFIAAVIIFKNRKTGFSAASIIAFILAGVFIVFPAGTTELALSLIMPDTGGIWKLLIDAVLISALIEETAKLLLLRLIFYIKNIKPMKAAVTIAVAAGTGFAFLENIMYSFDHSFIIIVRSLTAVPLHIITAGITGLYLVKRDSENRYIRYRGFAHAIVIHGLYDILISTQSVYSFLIIPLLLQAGYSLYMDYKRESGSNPD